MRILGIDPGLDATGYGIIDFDGQNFKVVEAGLVRTSHKRPMEKRLKKIYSALTELIKEFQPKVLVLEKLYSHYKHPTTAILMGHARGVCCLLSGMFDIELINYSPTRIKKAVTGKGNASKDQVQRMVEMLLNLKDAAYPADVTDALALAMGYVYVNQRSRYDFQNLRQVEIQSQ